MGSVASSIPVSQYTVHSAPKRKVQFGHGTHGETEKPVTNERKRPSLKLFGFYALDAALVAAAMYASISAVEIVQSHVPALNHSTEEHAEEHHENEGLSTTTKVLISAVSGIAHNIPHMLISGAWFLYGRRRGSQAKDEENKDFAKLQAYAQSLSKDSKDYEVVMTGPCEFKVVKKSQPENV